MAIRPDFDIGTITLSSGSADFTTTGSALEVAKVSAGDAIITPSGHVLIIASITGQNSGTLFLPCPPAAAGTGLALRIRFQPDGSRYQGAVRNLIDLLSSGNVEAFAALVGSAGLVPIFTGVGTMDLADPATFGIPDPNGSLGKLAALTLAANKILNTDASGNLTQSDITAAALVLLKLAGTAASNKLPFFDSASSAALADFTAAAQAMLNLSGTAAADRLPYLTGANGAGLTVLTAFARSILDDANGAAVWATLGAAGSTGTGSGWFRLPGGHIAQYGTQTGTTDTIGVMTVTLPTGYSSGETYKAVAWNGDYNLTGTTSNVRSAVWPANTGFAVRWRDYNGNPVTSSARRVDWIAIGS